MMKTLQLAMTLFIGLETALGGELENGFARPPAANEPAASAELSADLYRLKLRSDEDALAGKETVTCNRAWPQAASLVRYIARCRFLLRAGKAAPKTEGDFTFSGTPAKIRHARREYPDGTVGYFLAYPENGKKARVRLSFACAGKYPELWDPDTGRIVQPNRLSEKDGRSVVIWDADPGAAVFVLFRPQRSSAKKLKLVEESQIQTANVTGSWSPAPKPGEALSGKTVRFNDGSIVLSDYAAGVWLDLGDASGTIEVKVNGKKFPVLWKPPYRVDVVDTLQLEDTEHTIAPGAAVDMRSPLEVELKVTGTLGTPSWTFAGN